MCILQVSFVFTNQVDGKLVPVESMVRSAAHQQNGIAATGEKGVQKTDSPSKPGRQSLNGKNLKLMGFNLKNLSLKCSTKSRTSPNCLQYLMMILFEFQLKTTYIVSSVDVLSVAYIVSSAFYGAYCIFFSCFYNFLLLKKYRS